MEDDFKDCSDVWVSAQCYTTTAGVFTLTTAPPVTSTTCVSSFLSSVYKQIHTEDTFLSQCFMVPICGKCDSSNYLARPRL